MTLFFISGCVATGLDSITVNKVDFPNNPFSSSDHVYIRYSDGTVDGTTEDISQIKQFSVKTDPEKTIVGGYISDGTNSWVPSGFGYEFSWVDVYGQTTKPTHPVAYYAQVGDPVANAAHPGFVNVLYAIYDANGQSVDGRPEVFAHSIGTTFYNDDPLDLDRSGNYLRTDFVTDGYSWFANHGEVIFVINSNDFETKPISLYSGDTLLSLKPSISVSVSPSSASVVQGGSEQLTATVDAFGGAATTVTWSSSDATNKVTVDSTGKVTVASDAPTGDYTITAISTADSSKKGTATITVTTAPAVTGVSVSPSSASIVQGSSQQLKATVDAIGGAATTVTWTSSDTTNKVVVDNTGKVTVALDAVPGITRSQPRQRQIAAKKE
ncbi:Ig-like domain-containing protein [Paenibacillus sp. D2_2]|uniref:Ig-like domain-containing protein n=1 Tax=Paenibacillus sp. D2_2 TaxID=3073092 RepID=UPI00281570BB|nr:Ig-like domain-containing protein [Paenibacillus sp. D2_2]WMT41206.1 Ig-like domain-containing protein [Paenibacillus sp. D2_2]